MIKKSVSFYEVSQVNYLFWKKEMRPKIKVGVRNKVTMLRKGFHGESKYIYKLTKENQNDYLSDYRRLKSKFINKKYSFVLNNKITFERTFRDFIKIPKSIALISKGKIVPLDGEVSDVQSMVDYIKEKGYAVMKPIAGGGGAGVNILKMVGENIYANNKLITINDLSRKIEKLDEYFISEFIEQGNFAAKLNPSTLNSIRIVTMIDPENNEAFIPIAVQRIGTKSSAPADNWTQGGISAEIDIDSGLMGRGVTYPLNREIIWHEKHPDTNSEIEGVKVPNWESVKNTILNAAEKHPYIKYVGWDVVSTDEGVMVIEANNCTDVNLLQIHRPLLKDERVKKFYKHYGII